MEQSKYSREKISWKIWNSTTCCQNVTFFFSVLLKDKCKNYMLEQAETEKCPTPDTATWNIELWYNCTYCHFSHWKELFLGNFDRGELVGLNIDLNYHLKRKLMKIPFHRESFLHLWAWDRTRFNESLACDSIPAKIVYAPSSSSLYREEQDIMWGFSAAWGIWFWPL